VPFVLIAAQLVVRFGFAPIPVLPEGQDPGSLLAGSGVLFEVAMRPGEEARVAGLRVVLPPHGLTAISPLVRNTSDGRAFQELVATESGAWDLDLQVDGVSVGSKRLVAGAVGERVMQPERVSSFWASWLWPAEETFAADSPIDSAAFAYPARDLGPLPGGPGGVILIFFLSSMLFGVLVLKPLKIQI